MIGTAHLAAALAYDVRSPLRALLEARGVSARDLAADILDAADGEQVLERAGSGVRSGPEQAAELRARFARVQVG